MESRSAPHEVFVSYASPDAAVATAVVTALERAGHRCWMAPRDVTPGAQYADEIIGAINDARVMVLVLSAQAIESPHVGKEIERASSKRRRIIALRVDATPLTRSLEYFLSESQWIDYRPGEAGEAFDRLVHAVEVQPAAAPPPVASAAAGAAAPAATARAGATTPRRPWGLLAAGGVAALALGGFVSHRFWSGDPTVAGPPGPPASPAPSVAAATAVPAAAPAVSDKSIAVLPFADLSEKKDQEYFSDGLSEDLIDLLTKVPDLQVPARASSFYFKGQHTTIPEIAKALGVAYVLEGSVRRAGNTVRVRTELIRADNGYDVWSETYDRELKDIFRVQDEIAGRVVTALKVVLPSSKSANPVRTVNPEAYNQYLLGRRYELGTGKEGLSRAVEAFRKATALDPGYVDAYSWLGATEAVLGDHTGQPALITDGVAMAERAIALAPGDPSGYVTRGSIREQLLWDWAGAREDLGRAKSLTTGYLGRLEAVRADLAATEGRLDEAIAILEEVARHDPLDPYDWRELITYLTVAGRFDDARAVDARLDILVPPTGPGSGRRFDLDLLQGHPDRALADAAAEHFQELQLMGTSVAQHSLGRERESREALDELEKKWAASGAYQVAAAHAWRGEKDQAFAWLDRAYAQHDGGLTSLKYDPLVASLRSDPRYKAILARMRLPP